MWLAVDCSSVGHFYWDTVSPWRVSNVIDRVQRMGCDSTMCVTVWKEGHKAGFSIAPTRWRGEPISPPLGVRRISVPEGSVKIVQNEGTCCSTSNILQ